MLRSRLHHAFRASKILRTPSRLSPHAARCLSTASIEGGVKDPYTYCKNLVRKRDYEAFLTAQFYPKALQDSFFALRAFYIELASIQESVSTPLIGRMRIQFWRDALRGFSDNRPPQHPIALALFHTSRQANLPTYHLKRLIDARDTELDVPTHMTVDSLTKHAESTSSTFLYLLLALLGQSSSHTYSHAASHVGVVQTISTLLRSLPYHASKGQLTIPAEITARLGVSQEEVFRYGGEAKKIDDAVFEFATVANDHLITARDMFTKECGGKVPGPVKPVFLSAISAAWYLERLEQVNFDVFEPVLQQRSWRLPWRIYRGYYQAVF